MISTVPPVDLSHITLDPDIMDPSSEPEPRIAVAFFSQLKNLQPGHVTNMIDKVLKPLLENFNHVDVYLHSFNALTFNNPRNGEDHCPINVTRSLENLVAGLRAVNPAGKIKIKGISITDAKDADATFKPFEYYLEHGDCFKNGGLSLFNVRRALYNLQASASGDFSVTSGRSNRAIPYHLLTHPHLCTIMPTQAVTKLWQDKRVRTTLADGTEHVEEYYQAVVYARTDVIYKDRLQLIPQKWNATTKQFHVETKADGLEKWTWDELVRNNTLYVPVFDPSGGLNDRFAYGRPPVMRLYGNRVQDVEPFFEQYPNNPLCAERFLQTALIEMHGVQPSMIERFNFARVRANGKYGTTRQLLTAH